MTIFESTGRRILVMQCACFVVLLLAITQGLTYWWFLTAISYFIISAFGLSLTLHRTVAHRSWIPNPIFYKVLSVMSCFCLTGSPLSYAYIHRMHHAYTDGDKDPHSPKHGILKSLFGMHEPEKFHGNMIRDLLRDPFQMFLHNYYLLTLLIIMGIVALLSPSILIYGLLIPGILSGMTSRLHNWVTHEPRFGYKSFHTNDNSRNVPWLNAISCFTGEGWANNHHAFAWDYNFGKRTNNIDIVGNFVDLCVKLGLGQYNPSREGKVY